MFELLTTLERKLHIALQIEDTEERKHDAFRERQPF